MACGCVSRKTAKITLGISSVVLILSIGMIIAFPVIYNKVLKEYIALGEGSLVTKIWEDIPLPIYEKLYFFNITNEEAFLEGTEPLNVTEVGPYTFKSRWVKDHPKWNPNNTVSYTETRTYEFVPEMSNGTEDDIIVTLNGPMILAANVVSDFIRWLLDGFCIIKGEDVIIRKTIRELAYEGYDDPIIKRAKGWISGLPYQEGKFSWLYGKNASNDGLFTVFTGTDDDSKTNFINKWNGNEMLNFWKDDTCNMLNGTSIETGPPIKDHIDSYTFFQSFFCRSVTFNYTEDARHFDIPAKRFEPTRDLFANSTENPDNHCFEVKKERASGVLDISSCQFGAPVLVSFPHFHLADPSFLSSVNGLSPDQEKHGSHIDVEPITGLSIDLVVRFQINLEIQKLTNFHYFNKVTKGVFPVFWAELSLKIDEDLASFLKHKVRDPKIIAYTVIGSLFLMSWIGIVISIIILCESRSEENEPLIVAKESKMPSEQACYDYKQNEEIYTEKNPKSIESDKHSSTVLSINNSEMEKNNSNESRIQVEGNS